jgi:hypothetical protein
MTRYLISIADGTMDVSDEELPDVADAAHAVVRDAKRAGVWVFGGGLNGYEASIVATDGAVTEGASPTATGSLAGFAVVDVPSREEALMWAARIAVACRCAQEVRELLPDSEV